MIRVCGTTAEPGAAAVCGARMWCSATQWPLHLEIFRRSSRAVRDSAPITSVLCCAQVEGREAEEVRDTLAHNYGIMVRHYRKELLDGFVRVSVGKPDQTDALLAALRDMAAAGGNGSA